MFLVHIDLEFCSNYVVIAVCKCIREKYATLSLWRNSFFFSRATFTPVDFFRTVIYFSKENLKNGNNVQPIDPDVTATHFFITK